MKTSLDPAGSCSASLFADGNKVTVTKRSESHFLLGLLLAALVTSRRGRVLGTVRPSAPGPKVEASSDSLLLFINGKRRVRLNFTL